MKKRSDPINIVVIVIILIRIMMLFFIKKIISYEEIAHYIIARDVFLDPITILCPYAKLGFTLPIYILIFITNDIFGIYIVRFMIIICSGISSIFCYRILKHMKFSEKESLFGTIIFHLGNYNTLFQQAGLTESFALLFIIIGYYLFLLKEYNRSSLILSFGFIVRNEVLFLIIILGMVYFFKIKKYIPIVLFGIFPMIWLASLLIANYDWTVLLTYNSETYFGQRIIQEVPPFRNNLTVLYYYFLAIITYYGVFLSILCIIGFYYIIKNRKYDIFLGYIGIYLVYFLFVLSNHLTTFDQSFRFLILLNSFMFIVITYGASYFFKSIFAFLTKIRLMSNFLIFRKFNHESFQKFYSIGLVFVVFLGMISNSFFLKDWVMLDYDARDRAQLEIINYIRGNYDLYKIKVLCPTELPIVFMADRNPYIFLYPVNEYNYANSSYSVVIPIKGFFYRDYKFVNLIEFMSKGDLIIWVDDIRYSNSSLNPVYVNEKDFTPVYMVNDTILMIVYEKQ